MMTTADHLFLINKPFQWTSFQVVSFIKKRMKQQLKTSVKVGHAGTLDPLATGLLIICTGKKTKEIPRLMNLPKTYTGVIEIGKTTPSYDLETPFDHYYDISAVTEKDILITAQRFTGEIEQTPPAFSAKWIKGKRAYTLARKNQQIQLAPVKIYVHSFIIHRIQLPEIFFEVTVSKGTYIRSLAHDFGKALNNGAYLKLLQRTKIGDYSLEEALTLSEWEKQWR